MNAINPYLAFPGNTEEVFTFYKSVFGGEFTEFMRFKDMPESEECESMPAEEMEKIMHIGLPVGKDSILMGSDGCWKDRENLKTDGNISLSLSTDSEEETDRVFNALADDGTVIMPLEKMFWNSYFGMVKDKYGIQWMLNYSYDSK